MRLDEFKSNELDRTLVKLERLTNNRSFLMNKSEALLKTYERVIYYCTHTLYFNEITDKVWNVVNSKYSIEYATENNNYDYLVTPDNFRRCILGLALSNEFSNQVKLFLNSLSSNEKNLYRDLSKEISVKDAKDYWFFSCMPIIALGYNSYIINNKGDLEGEEEFPKIDEQDYPPEAYTDSCYIEFMSDILTRGKGSNLADGLIDGFTDEKGKELPTLQKVERMFNAVVKDIANKARLDAVRGGLNMRNLHVPRSYRVEQLDPTKPINNKPSKFGDAFYLFKQWDDCSKDSRWIGTSANKPSRKAKVFKFLVLNALDDLNYKQLKDIYTDLYSDIQNPKQKFEQDIFRNPKTSVSAILKDYDLTIEDIVSLCKLPEIGTEKVLGKLKGKGLDLPDNVKNGNVSDIIKNKYNRDLLNERRRRH